MDELGQIHQLIIPLGSYRITINLEVLMMTGVVFILALTFGFVASRKRRPLPSRLQILGELIVLQFYGLTEEALGRRHAKTYAPLICALFIFLLVSNWLGMLPHLEEPTRDLNTPLSLGILGFVVAHYVGIREKGLKDYAKAYFQPVFFLMPLNVIGELAKIVSISFRLFGNIMGGAIIILVVSYLTFSVLLPPFLNIFFGLFVGTIQAFVFTMLTVVYISVQLK
ncbi:MAG TPA: F0F1 ATP synthase subunit A [Desulfosarcina sp.]|nr:F0F1 ATP synthase subunit A [Desulfosarcina sp.]